MIACLGETTGVHSLTNILAEMRKSEEGLRILIDKPRINTQTIDLDALKNLPDDSFGYLYRKFLDDNVINMHMTSINLKIFLTQINLLFASLGSK